MKKKYNPFSPMKHFLRKKRSKAGLAPGTLVYTGQEKQHEVYIESLDYTENHLEKRRISDLKKISTSIEKSTGTWIRVNGVHDIGKIRDIGTFFKLHSLIQEDIVNTDQRTKVENCDGQVFVVLKGLKYQDQQLLSEQISMVIDDRYVLTFQEEESRFFDPIITRLEDKNSRLRKRDVSYLAYALIDLIVDQYFIVLEKMSEEIESLNQAITEDQSETCLNQLQLIRRELILFQKVTTPITEITTKLQKEFHQTSQDQLFWQDLHDHALHIHELTRTYTEMLSGLFDLYFSLVSLRTNQVMQALTVLTIIFLPLTLIAGIYGMNFEYMPELQWHWGYPAVIGGMIILALLIYFYFKRKKWV